jgi:hypothetical protein
MSRVRLIDKIFSAVITAVTTILMLGFLLLWITNSEPVIEDDGTTVTIEYDCKEVIVEPDDFPQQVVDECSSKPKFSMKTTKNTI